MLHFRDIGPLVTFIAEVTFKLKTTQAQWRPQEFLFGGIALRGYGDESLTKAEAVCRHRLQILTAKTIKI